MISKENDDLFSLTTDHSPLTTNQATDHSPLITSLTTVFAHAKTFGSLIQIPPELAAALPNLEAGLLRALESGDVFASAAAEELIPLVRQAKILAMTFDVVVANPPYMGGKGMNTDLKEFAKKNFSDSKSDLFAMFIDRGFSLLEGVGGDGLGERGDNDVEISRHSGMDRRNPDCMDASKTHHPWSLGSGAPCRNDEENLNSTRLGQRLGVSGQKKSGIGFNAMVTMQSWMFLSSYQSMREKLLKERTIHTMAHLGPRAFAEISGEVVQTTAFVLQGQYLNGFKPVFFRLVEGQEEQKQTTLRTGNNRFDKAVQDDFKKTPSSPIAYWVSDRWRDIFSKCIRLDVTAPTREGMVTGNNALYVRYWHEVPFFRIFSGIKGGNNCERKHCRWFPYIKGGTFRKWYGNKEYVVDWESDGKRIRTTIDPIYNKIRGSKFNLDYIFRPFVSWNAITSGNFSARISFANEMFDSTGPASFPNPSLLASVVAFLNSIVAQYTLGVINPTVRFLPSDIGSLPFPPQNEIREKNVSFIAEEAISISKCDWDNFETSWDFTDFPLLRKY